MHIQFNMCVTFRTHASSLAIIFCRMPLSYATFEMTSESDRFDKRNLSTCTYTHVSWTLAYLLCTNRLRHYVHVLAQCEPFMRQATAAVTLYYVYWLARKQTQCSAATNGVPSRGYVPYLVHGSIVNETCRYKGISHFSVIENGNAWRFGFITSLLSAASESWQTWWKHRITGSLNAESAHARSRVQRCQ